MRKLGTAILVSMIAGLAGANDAAAFGRRSFVAAAGADVGTCTPAAPCRSFGYAIDQTSAGGEVIVLDTAGYGAVAITKAITIAAPPGVYAGITVVAGNGVTVNAGATDVVVLRGLTVTGIGATNGVAVLSTGTTHLEGCVISGFETGLLFEVGAGSTLIVADTVLRDNNLGINALGFGLKGGLAVVRSRLHHNAFFGIKLQDVDRASVADSYLGSNQTGIAVLTTTAATAHTSLSIQRTEFTQNTNGLIARSTAATANKTFVDIANSTVAGGRVGINAEDGGFIRVAGTQITGNLFGIAQGGTGVLVTLGTNMLYGNDTNGAFTSSISPN